MLPIGEENRVHSCDLLERTASEGRTLGDRWKGEIRRDPGAGGAFGRPFALQPERKDLDPRRTHMRVMLRKIIAVGALVLLGQACQAQDKGFGLGFVIGEPTGISMKGWVSGDKAIAGAVAWSVWNGASLHLQADMLFHKPDLIKVGKGRLPLYYGPGLRMRFWNDGRYWRHGKWYNYDGRRRSDLAVRFPVGLAYWFDGAPVDVFLEVAPTLTLVPSTWVEFEGALGARYWF